MSDEMSQRFLRMAQLRQITGLSKSTIYRLEELGRFPARLKLTGRASAWRMGEVLRWMEARPRANRQESRAA